MRHFLIPAVLTMLLGFGSSAAALQKDRLSVKIGDAPEAAVNYTLTELASGLDTAWSLAFLPDGDMLVTEKAGRLRVIRNDQLLPKAVEGVPEVSARGQGGLFDVVPHPDFAENRLIYLAYAHAEGSKKTLRMARAEFVRNNEGGSLDNFEVLFTGDSWRTSTHHYGGRIVFLPDGTLLLTSGEGSNRRQDAPKLDSHFGKILRFNDDGSVPGDNPFVGQKGALPEIWSYGHRNPQGLVYDTKNDVVYSHEHGPRGGDEVNIVEKSKHYGWPLITYGIDYSGTQITPYTKLDGMEQSVVHYIPSIAPSGLTIYYGDKFPEWQGDLFIGALAHRHVRRIDLEGGKFGAQEKLFSELGRRIRDVRTGPDGYLYILMDNKDARVIRVSPK